MKRVLATLALAGGIGCGTSYDGPATYVLDRDSNRVAAGALAPIGPFSLPSGAVVTYTITDTPFGIGADSMTFAIDPGGYAAFSGASITTSTPPLPAGSYYLDVTCENFVDDCEFDDEVTASY